MMYRFSKKLIQKIDAFMITRFIQNFGKEKNMHLYSSIQILAGKVLDA